MKYFVTGGAGFIGSAFVRGLLDGSIGEKVEKVTVFDAFTYAGNRANLAICETDNRLRVVKGDVRDSAQILSELPGHDIVVHFAAESHVDRSIGSSSVFIKSNVLGTHQMLECALKSSIPTFIHVSTDEVYGSINSGSWTEDEPLLPNSPYAASKASSDLVARSFFRTFGYDVRITRCSNNFGPFQYPEKVIPLFITNLIDKKKVPLYGHGLNVRDWLHVEDHCRGIDLVISKGKPGEIYNIGGGTELTNRELTMTILEHFRMGEEMIQPVQDRLGHDLRYSVDWSKIKTLGYSPVHSFHADIESVIDWYRSNEDWWRPILLSKQ